MNYLILFRQICGAFFLKAGGWQTVMLHTRFNPNAYWYSFDFFGKVSLIGADETLPRGMLTILA